MFNWVGSTKCGRCVRCPVSGRFRPFKANRVSFSHLFYFGNETLQNTRNMFVEPMELTGRVYLGRFNKMWQMCPFARFRPFKANRVPFSHLFYFGNETLQNTRNMFVEPIGVDGTRLFGSLKRNVAHVSVGPFHAV